MGKDKESKAKAAVPVAGGEQLKHSPFAALANRTAPAAALSEEPAPAPVQPKPSKSRGRVVLRRETKHRGGKAVVIIGGLSALEGFDLATIAALAKDCKHALACGGTVEAGEIVLQGDQPARVAQWLRAQGFRVDGVTS
jgi:predicted translation initiation factor SUI1